MKWLVSMLLFLGCAALAGAAGRIAKGQIFPELRLKNGQVLRQVVIVAVGSESVMARWEGGRGNILFSNLPDHSRENPPERRPAAEPVKPPDPVPIHGSIGDETGAKVMVSGRVEVTGRDGEVVPLAGIRIYAFGQNEFKALNEEYYSQVNPLFEYYQTMVHRKSLGHDIPGANLLLEQMESLFDRDLTYLPKGPRAETNAGGEFQLEHSLKEPYVITARAIRFDGDRTVRYRWVIPSSDLVAGRILLSTENLKH